MMALYNIPLQRQTRGYGMRLILGMSQHPTTVSFWHVKSDGRKVLLRRMRKSLIEKSFSDGYARLNIPTIGKVTALTCYICYSLRGEKYYCIAPNLVTAMQTRKFWTTRGRVYPKCQIKKNEFVPPLVPQWTPFSS